MSYVKKNSLSIDIHTNNLVILPGNYKKLGKTANILFLFTSFFQHFKCDHHFLFNLEEKIKQHNNINITSKRFEVLWNAGRCVTQSKSLNNYFSE